MLDIQPTPVPGLFWPDVLLTLHVVWAAWMVTGIVLAVLGFWFNRLWHWRLFRIIHMAGLIGTATVPLWYGRLCPLTLWEWNMRAVNGHAAGIEPRPFMVRLFHDILYFDVDPAIMSIITAIAAVGTVVIFITHPPRKRRPTP